MFRFGWHSWAAATFGPRIQTTRRTAINSVSCTRTKSLRWLEGAPIDIGKRLITWCQANSREKKLSGLNCPKHWADILLMWKVTWRGTKQRLQKKHIDVSLRLTIISRKTDSDRGNFISPRFWRVSMRTRNEKKNTLKRLVAQIRSLGENEESRSWVFNYRKDTLWFNTLAKIWTSSCSEPTKREEELRTEWLDNSRKQALWSKRAQLLTKSDSNHSEIKRILKPDTASDWLTTLNENK